MACKHWVVGRYSYEYLEISHYIKPTVGWENGAYVGTVMGRKTGPFRDIQLAREETEKLAKVMLEGALKRLNEV